MSRLQQSNLSEEESNRIEAFEAAQFDQVMRVLESHELAECYEEIAGECDSDWSLYYAS